MNTKTRLFKLSVIFSLLVLALAVGVKAASSNGAQSSAHMASGQEEVQAFTSRLTPVYRDTDITREIMGALTASQHPLNIIGRDQSGAYLAVDLGYGQGWVAANDLEISGDVDRLAVFPAQEKLEPVAGPEAVTGS